MNHYESIVRRYYFAAGLVFILLVALPINAKSGRASASQPTKSSPGSATSFNLSDFGAVGNGVTDDGPALQKALDALAAARGGTLVVPAGRYLIATPVAKDFSGLGATVNIQGVASLTMPAPPSATGEQLSVGLHLTSEIIPATGANHNAISLSNLHRFKIEHISFVGRPGQLTDAFISLYFSDIDEAIVRHCEFYGVSSLGGGNVIRAVRSVMSIELSVFLGCTANSGAYAPIVENIEWRSFKISNSIFLDFGQRALFSKMGLAAPLSWINMANVAAPTPVSPRREFVVRDTFFDEGGWIGITAFPHRQPPPIGPIDLVYISGLKMNVSNLATAGHSFYDVNNIMIENSHYGWSRNAFAAIDLHRIRGHAIFDNLTCIDHADRLRADDHTQRLTVINSVFGDLDSKALITTVIDTPSENDPVQYVRRQFVSVAGRQPEPAAHFYWSDQLIKCGENNACLDGQRAALNDYLTSHPKSEFSISGTISDENGVAISGANVSLTGSQSVVALTDSNGNYSFSHLPTSGIYTVAVNKQDYSFTPSSKVLVHPADNVTIDFSVDVVSKQRPQLITIEGSGLAVALEAVNFTTQPFSIFNPRFGNDGITRVIVFAKNLDFVNSPSQISVIAEDDKGLTYPLQVEYISELAGHSLLKQLNVKLSPNLPVGTCIRFRLSVADVHSNDGRICLAK